jgi:hypothetical protein
MLLRAAVAATGLIWTRYSVVIVPVCAPPSLPRDGRTSMSY